MPDREAIRCLKHGDISGLETLITRYQVRAIRTAFLIVQDEPLAEDIVQDTFLHLYQRIHSFDEDRPFEPYLLRCVVNAAITAARKRSWETPLDRNGDVEGLETLFSEAVSVESQAEFSELQRSILVAIARLPLRQRAAIVQRYYLEMGEDEMAAKLEIAPGTVKWLLHAARLRLRALLGSQRSVK